MALTISRQIYLNLLVLAVQEFSGTGDLLCAKPPKASSELGKHPAGFALDESSRTESPTEMTALFVKD